VAPTDDFTREGDHLHRFTTLNSLPRGCCATLFSNRVIKSVKRGTFYADIGQSEWSHIMPRLLALLIAASILGTSTAAFAAPEPARLRGTVKSISDTTLVVHTTSGTDETLDLTAKTGYLTVAKSNLDHIDPGGYIGVATKSIGDKPVALGVLLFPPAMKGAAEGHFDWDPIADTTLSGGATTASAMTNGTVAVAKPAAGAGKVTSTMTNGTVSSAGASGGAKHVTVTYKGGKQIVLVPPTAPVVTVVPGNKSDVTVGSVVFINALKEDGKESAAAIFVGLDFL
jgi:hypothetical protein